ncbi:hypothetical protein TTHERM_00201740 (macronuclear) [Tetrahymena thermophila SB210]|uniref:AIG1 family protein n=1 Tax=Tetrahymena thermophila (strain SB210) TaxID=312017 RepID=Q22NH2_TETTS|nr:hypothetical protein TTHERM_00201740 [Tetrahymena thermophila SB210]EAR86813.2 hypothetical protein TTHERM_00201740 [Tetrahymena thermophila SB210]|eukprot:XP_001007058.2 hypothetical protein TTHERM_00201740 [Tetrahymena thermophila SB210]
MMTHIENLSIAIGNSQQGKDTFIWSLDQNLLNSHRIKIDRCTELIGLNQGIILNTIGLGDSSLKLTDSDIVTQIYEHFLRQISKICSDIHTLYFVQGLDASPVTQIERSLIYMQAALGKEIFKSSVIIATKWNKLDQDELEEKIKYLKEIADKYQIKGEVIDYRCPYKKIIKNKEQYGIPVTDEEFAKSKQELHKILMSLKFLEIKPHLEKLQNEIEKLKSEIKENSKYTREYFVKKERKERQWFSLWIVQHTMTYYEQQQETLFSKTDQDILEEAIDRGLQKNINEMKEALQQLSSQQ